MQYIYCIHSFGSTKADIPIPFYLTPFEHQTWKYRWAKTFALVNGKHRTNRWYHIWKNLAYHINEPCFQQPRSPGFKPLEKCHMERACKNLNDYLSKYKLHQRFTLEEFEHWFLPRKDIVYSYVVEVRVFNRGSFYLVDLLNLLACLNCSNNYLHWK